MAFDLNKIIRENIRTLKPYSSARDEFKGNASVFLDANENPFGSPSSENFNRYPDPLQCQLKFALTRVKGVPAENIFIGNGSDEIIDLAIRIFCDPGKDNVIICPPTYGMYEVSAAINNVAVKKVFLKENFQLDTKSILENIDAETKIIFICSPNNPTGNSMQREDVEMILQNFEGIVLIDEAYINYSRQKTFIQELTKYPNLIVMQTMSKAWGLAALRIGICYASMDIVDVFNKVKPPYNVNEASQKLAEQALQESLIINEWIRETVEQRNYLTKILSQFSFVEKIFPSDANFILIKVSDAKTLYDHLSANGIVVRNRSNDPLCQNCLRLTIGTPEENETLLLSFQKFQS